MQSSSRDWQDIRRPLRVLVCRVRGHSWSTETKYVDVALRCERCRRPSTDFGRRRDLLEEVRR